MLGHGWYSVLEHVNPLRRLQMAAGRSGQMREKPCGHESSSPTRPDADDLGAWQAARASTVQADALNKKAAAGHREAKQP
ncbi:hypothetical protein CDD82_1663 [Ophiocordyceps australis]|uniref:Uncharacterized protein n=1 Tax=Ophiocordyceps australis TaxID=1399860 RepID=A0A2C5XK47_9HYPO|nr:hypothetical protein CDD82_1663 [Ophiocordyceps australis]